MPRGHIVVLFHQSVPRWRMKNYLISHMARAWEAMGFRVSLLRGIRRFRPADLCVLHVDLSLVPDHYAAFAARYPVVLNGRLGDVRKRAFSRLLVEPDSDYRGAVIVKTDLNYAGRPERFSAGLRGLVMAQLDGLRQAGGGMSRQRDYRIYDTLDQVPGAVFADDRLVVEKFLPSRIDGRYGVYFYKFLGDAGECVMNLADEPVITSFNTVQRRPVDLPTEVAEFRREIGMDYGKIDFVMDGERPAVIDINKTPGVGRKGLDRAYYDSIAERARGIVKWFD